MKLRKRNKLLSGVGVNDADYNVYEYGIVEGKKDDLDLSILQNMEQSDGRIAKALIEHYENYTN